jgi:hypothetical protein
VNIFLCIATIGSVISIAVADSGGMVLFFLLAALAIFELKAPRALQLT